MFGVVGEDPVWLAGHGREQYGDVRFMPYQMPARQNQRPLGTANQFWIGQLDQAAVVLDQMISVQCGQALCMEKQVFLDLLADDLRENQSADSRGTNGQHGFVEAPQGDDPRGEHIGIQEEPDSAASGHFTCELRRDARFAGLVAE